MIESDSELWGEIAEFLLRVQRHPKFKPETVEEVQRSLDSIPAIRNAIRSIDDDEKYIEMIIMADENEEILNYTLKQLLDEKSKC
ncbi:MAG: hypothetical protein ACXVHY_06290 [Methanobacterium sp.]